MTRRASRACVSFSGFSLVEIVIVIAILGILAALVVPQFTNASGNAKSASLKTDLRYLRTQIMVYRAHHDGVSPGYPGGDASLTPTNAALAAQLTQYSNSHGQTAAAATSDYRFGPYLPRMPVNPVNGSDQVLFVAPGGFPTAPQGVQGWVYQPDTGTIAANVPGTDDKGTAYFDY